MLDLTGLESVMTAFLMKNNYSWEEIQDYLCSPAYFAWFWMQNLEGYGGPLTRLTLKKRLELADRIHARMKVYHIEPVMPGFNGMVPLDFTKKNADAVVYNTGNWENFSRPGMLRCHEPDGDSDIVFHQQAHSFYSLQKQILRTDCRYYAADPFHEGGQLPEDQKFYHIYHCLQKEMLKFRSDAVLVLQQWQNNVTREKLEGLICRKISSGSSVQYGAESSDYG